MKLRLAKKIYKDAEIKNSIRIHNVDRFLTSSEWTDIIFPTLHSDEEVDNYLYKRFPNNYRYNSFMFNRAYIRIGQWFRRYNDRHNISVQVQQKTFLKQNHLININGK